jgi:hypothetical protein
MKSAALFEALNGPFSFLTVKVTIKKYSFKVILHMKSKAAGVVSFVGGSCPLQFN